MQRHLMNFLLGQHHPIGADARVLPAQLREKLCPRQFTCLLVIVIRPLVSFLDMHSPGIDAMP